MYKIDNVIGLGMIKPSTISVVTVNHISVTVHSIFNTIHLHVHVIDHNFVITQPLYNYLFVITVHSRHHSSLSLSHPFLSSLTSLLTQRIITRPNYGQVHSGNDPKPEHNYYKHNEPAEQLKVEDSA